jgi:hypothetical protein
MSRPPYPPELRLLPVPIRLNAADRQRFRELGGVRWLREMLAEPYSCPEQARKDKSPA